MQSESRLIDLVFPGETNHHGTLFGGSALSYMDKLAYIIATRHGHCDFVTASCEKIDFAAPARLSQIVEVTGRILRAGRRSLNVEIDLMAEDVLTGERHLCSRGGFNMVTADPTQTVPPLPPAPPQAPADGAVRMIELVFPDQSSHRQVLFGGYALAVMGKAAFVAATRLCRKTVVMAASSRMNFTAPVHVGEIMELIAAVSTVGRSSMTVSVTAWGENLQTGERWPAANGSFVMVAVDGEGKAIHIGHRS
ncbi:MAG TPA: hotdog domain-containing protein [Candidatus Sulfotelmatobacter sp.]|jgi:acyl-CoA hydrolase|nr:hotdog domain-containing protein [Candidatus Sulfotelmatobacter sp.]